MPFVDLIQAEVIENDTCPTNLLRVAIKSLIKIFDQVDNDSLNENDEYYKFDPSSLLQSLMVCQFDDHSNHID